LSYFEIVVRNAEGEYRQLIVDPVPSKENFYRHREDPFVIEDWSSLASVPGDLLAAALEPGKSWLAWVFFVVGFPVLIFYCWLLAISVGAPL
jgi:hypothetical protein